VGGRSSGPRRITEERCFAEEGKTKPRSIRAPGRKTTPGQKKKRPAIDLKWKAEAERGAVPGAPVFGFQKQWGGTILNKEEGGEISPLHGCNSLPSVFAQLLKGPKADGEK